MKFSVYSYRYKNVSDDYNVLLAENTQYKAERRSQSQKENFLKMLYKLFNNTRNSHSRDNIIFCTYNDYKLIFYRVTRKKCNVNNNNNIGRKIKKKKTV